MCHNEMGPVPNCDCNGNGKMGSFGNKQCCSHCNNNSTEKYL